MKVFFTGIDLIFLNLVFETLIYQLFIQSICNIDKSLASSMFIVYKNA